MSELTDAERAELRALLDNVGKCREQGYDMQISYSGWSVSFEGAEIGSRKLRGADGRSGGLIMVDVHVARQEAVHCASEHQRKFAETTSIPPGM